VLLFVVLLTFSMLLHLAYHGNRSTVFIIKYSGPGFESYSNISTSSDDVGSDGHPTTRASSTHLFTKTDSQYDAAAAQTQAELDSKHINSTTSEDLGSDGSPTANASMAHLNQHAAAAAQPQAVDPLCYLPPFEPACHAAWNIKEVTACLPVNCSLAHSCTVADKACCAYYNFQMLRDFDAFMTSKGLGDEYTLVYGTALGALRNRTILAHTEDIDIGLSVHAALVLSQNSTRLELWAAGYAFWYGDFWRMCPHIWHPSPGFRARMQPITHQQWVAQTKIVAPVYMDA
jgi:hypothetical protein